MTIATNNPGRNKPPFIDYRSHLQCEYCGKFLSIDFERNIAKCHTCEVAWYICRGNAEQLRKEWIDNWE